MAVGSSSSSSSSAPPSDALWRPERGPPVGGLLEDRGVEGAAAEVVDGDDVAGFHALGRGVVDRRRFGLRERDRVGEAGLANPVVEQLLLVRTPVRGVGDGDAVGAATLALSHLVHDPLEKRAHQQLR
jgi:hypothetical protein